MKRTTALLSAATLAAAGLVAAPALADSPQLVKPNATQKAGITKAWLQYNGGGTIPSGCLYIRLSKSNKHVAGLKSNVAKKPNKCAQYAFDGSAILYGQKKHWYMLVEGSDIKQSQCKAVANLMEPAPWGDLVDFAVLLGCENVD